MNKTKKYKIKSYRPSKEEKERIKNKILNVSINDIETEYRNLVDYSCKDVVKSSPLMRIGNNIVDYFTLEERLHTKGIHSIDFYTFWKNKKNHLKSSRIKKMYNFYKDRDIEDIRKFKYIFNIYYSSISIFRPLVAMEVYCKLNAKRVLDFTMGWGGRLVGAHIMGLDKYYGIDINSDLKPLYKRMVMFLQDQEKNYSKKKTEIELYFKNALNIDYSKFDYDTVLTSPPYYNIETYRNMEIEKYKTKNEWNQNFYKPLIETTWKYLKKNGNYCLNVSEEIYNSVCIQILGDSHDKIELKKKQRSEKIKYKEYIYIWKK